MLEWTISAVLIGLAVIYVVGGYKLTHPQPDGNSAPFPGRWVHVR